MLRFSLFCLTLLGMVKPIVAQGQGTDKSRLDNDTFKIDKRQFSLFHPAPRRYMRPMVPDPPGITESPYSVDAGHVQYETDALRLLTRREGTTYGYDLYVNHALAKVGLTDRTDLQVGVNSYTDARNYDEADPAHW